ncbi:hypothetical protein Gotri_010350 [Gossypium trilobum]|uniref:Thioredoxin domain-containing protein n=1 Tax=Gossypium trilobum TaxID=34281 RepID=A0A7J9EQ52_9ROSI|nr:hypothetical protein [Gossypium trilobum]
MVEEGQVISCHTVESWKEQLELAEESKKLVKIHTLCMLDTYTDLGCLLDFVVPTCELLRYMRVETASSPCEHLVAYFLGLDVVHFTASWSGTCRVIAPVLADLAKKLPNVTYLKVDVDELKVALYN